MMVLMKFQSSILMIKHSIRIILFMIIFGGLSLMLLGCKSDKYPRPTNAYYINDYANILYQATRSSIRREGERLYEITKDEIDGGAQLVVATFVVENVNDVANYDRTEIYRQWQIGKRDMGVLVLLFFEEEVTEDVNYLVLVETQIEIGYRMEQYVSAAQLGAIVDNTLYSDLWENDLDMGVMHMVYELLSAIYINAYDYESFNYDMDNYRDYLEANPDVSGDDSHIPLSWLLYLLTPYASLSDRIFALLPVILIVFMGGGGLFIRNKGGGGSSGGAGIFRRR